MRYFHPGSYQSENNYDGAVNSGEFYNWMWATMGVDIKCSVDQNLDVTVTPPSEFEAGKPIKLMTHGFTDNAGGSRALINLPNRQLLKPIF